MQRKNCYGKHMVWSKKYGYYVLGRMYTKEKAIAEAIGMMFSMLALSVLASVLTEEMIMLNVFLPIIAYKGIGSSLFAICFFRKYSWARSAILKEKESANDTLYEVGVQNGFSTVLAILFCLIDIVFVSHIVFSIVMVGILIVLLKIYSYRGGYGDGGYKEVKQKENNKYLLYAAIGNALVLVVLRCMGMKALIPTPVVLLFLVGAVFAGYENGKKQFAIHFDTEKGYEMHEAYKNLSTLKDKEEVEKRNKEQAFNRHLRVERIYGRWYPKKWDEMSYYERQIANEIHHLDLLASIKEKKS